ncbi:MAG: hypothetical protein M1833_005373 [Piccolia ochrophora]|nr:MAG: hypothetical protein M1833_005373 [Piccolia ochrophora]
MKNLLYLLFLAALVTSSPVINAARAPDSASSINDNAICPSSCIDSTAKHDLSTSAKSLRRRNKDARLTSENALRLERENDALRRRIALFRASEERLAEVNRGLAEGCARLEAENNRQLAVGDVPGYSSQHVTAIGGAQYQGSVGSTAEGQSPADPRPGVPSQAARQSYGGIQPAETQPG